MLSKQNAIIAFFSFLNGKLHLAYKGKKIVTPIQGIGAGKLPTNNGKNTWWNFFQPNTLNLITYSLSC
jgi:hypothetical protein